MAKHATKMIGAMRNGLVAPGGFSPKRSSRISRRASLEVREAAGKFLRERGMEARLVYSNDFLFGKKNTQ